MGSVQFEVDLTALDWSTNGLFLVAGDRNGCIHAFDAATLTKLGSAKGSLTGDSEKTWIEDVKISPNC